MKKRYFVELSYLGKNYSGWQIQPNAHTIQQELQDNLTKLNRNNPIKIIGCGRTDAGVHAQHYYMHMDYPEILDIRHFIFKLNHMLPKAIVILDVFEVHEKAHTRYNATDRTYKYYLHHFKNPFIKDTSWYCYETLDIQLMNEAASTLLNHRDFEAFSKVSTNVNNFICTVRQAQWEQIGEQMVFTISANRFLRNMVRAIVGTLIEVGAKRMTLDEFEAVILSKDRDCAGKSAPANGLTLMEVKYPFFSTLLFEL
ncbi:tRNA pseudouridine(38-40) synthase TruA [Putridiphycobacter roseus]|uniref:tRNA pseudouridine synthase A n=1 Tax=Putridiphycobacter roseus TaxID=2219161 RepID=A0A2W1N440_9FLAO|nr:tRNA pseudouridine(38-40) synthase TruA [Putridiphycobacter roseus]PZE18360.1 tRNA pseudouridine(38-40) synthase TruA [Putridiphycobacter roseus]